MPSIRRSDGVVIAWGGEVNGPIQHLNSMGAPTGVFSFIAQLGVGDADVHEMIVHVPAAAFRVLGTTSTPARDELARRCVEWYVEQQCRMKWVPGREEHFTVNEEEMRQIREAVLSQPQPKRYLCKVEVPVVAGGEPEYHVVEVSSLDNAIVKLKTRMGSNSKYNWDLAKVVELNEKL